MNKDNEAVTCMNWALRQQLKKMAFKQIIKGKKIGYFVS